MNDARAWRLNSTDQMLLHSAATLGSARIIQVLWRFPAPLPDDVLHAQWHRLGQGLLSRRPMSARTPAARDKWVPARNTEPLHLDRTPLTDATVLDWIDTQVRAPLPSDSPALWRLAAAPYQSGCLVSLTVPHFRSDGLGVINALTARHSQPQPPPGLRAGDACDALSQVARAAIETPRWALRLAKDAHQRALLTAALRRHPAAAGQPSAPRFFATTIVDVDAASWHDRAGAHAGTANSLFLEIAANLIRARVPRNAQAGIEIGVPMNLRRHADDASANALVVIPLNAPGGPVHHGDLQRTRHATKTLLQDPSSHRATLTPEPLWHLLPARLARQLKNPGAQQTDVVASNFGHAPEGLTRFAGHSAHTVAMRTMNVPGLVPSKARLRASLCLIHVGDRMTVTATGMPDYFGDSKSLQHLVLTELAAWKLTARPWWTTTAHEVKKG
jgi:hypothetical protein